MKKFLVAPAFASALFAAPLVTQADLVDGLLNYWNLDSGATDAAHGLAGSASGFQNDGSIAGAAPGSVTFTPGGPFEDGYALFDGNDGYIEIATGNTDIDRSGADLSISAWFRVDTFDANWQALIAKGESSDYRIARRGGENTMAYAGGTGDIPGAGIGPNINDGGWHHVVATTAEGGVAQLFIDGALVAASGAGASLSATVSGNAGHQVDSNLLIGENPEATNRNWFGGIDDVAMWNRVLTEAEISQLANSDISLGAIIPEPGTYALLLSTAALAAVALRRRRRT